MVFGIGQGWSNDNCEYTFHLLEVMSRRCQLGLSMLVHEPATRPGTVMSVGRCQSLGAFLLRRRRLSSKGECSFGLGDQSRLWGFPGPHVPGSLNLRVISFYLTMLGLILWT